MESRDFACRMCGERKARTLFSARDRLYGTPGRFEILRCLACGLRATHPLPDDLGARYHDDYAPHAAPDVRPLGGLLKRLFDLRTYWIPDLPPGSRVLEIGAGSGGFLRLLGGRGWEVHGLEPVPAAADRARGSGARVTTGELLGAGYPTAHFAAVFGWMVLEHVPRLRETLDEIARVLVPGGWFVFSVPNADSWEFSWFGGDWYALQVPTHVSHFGPEWLGAALPRAGLDVLRTEHQRNMTSILGSAGLRWNLPRLVEYAQSPSRAVQALLYPLACVLAAFRQGGRLTVAARKRE